MKHNVSEMKEIIFRNKQKIPWNEVEQYLKRYVGQAFLVREYQDLIYIAGDFPDEFSESRYTKSLRGALAKVKANSSQIIDLLIINAENRRWVENKNEKHKKDASAGWFRYDTYFTMPVKSSEESAERVNEYRATLVVRKTEKGLFLYDILDIKKEASTPHESGETVR